MKYAARLQQWPAKILIDLLVLLSALLSVTLVTTKAVATEQPKPKNLGFAFEDYWSKAKTIKPNDIKSHVKLYKDIVIKDQSEFYLDVVFDKREKGKTFDSLLEEALKDAVPIFIKHEKEIAENVRSFDKDAADQLGRLKKALPDFKIDFPIYGMVSLDHFAGGVRKHKGQQVLAISFDKLPAIDRDFDMVFSHEAFHVYHKQVNPTLQSDLQDSSDVILIGAFVEGLATFAEGALNPQKRERRMANGLAAWCKQQRYREVLQVFQQDNLIFSVKNYEKTKHLYRKWFYTKRDKEYSFPTEAGYCVGDRIVAKLAETFPLTELARWKIPRVIKESKAVLHRGI